MMQALLLSENGASITEVHTVSAEINVFKKPKRSFKPGDIFTISGVEAPMRYRLIHCSADLACYERKEA